MSVLRDGSRSSLRAAGLCAGDSIAQRILEADDILGKDTLAVIFETRIGILSEESICLTRILLVRDLVVEIDELDERLAHDELGCRLYRSIDTLDVVDVLEELTAGLVLTADDVARAGFALVCQSEHRVRNVSYVYECAAAFLRRSRAVIDETV